MDAYDLSLPRRVAFGWGRRRELGTLAASVARRAWIVLGSRTLEDSPLWAEMLSGLRSAGVAAEVIARPHREPLVEDVDGLVRMLRSRGAGPGDGVVAIGGGSAIDLGKAAAALVTNEGGESVRDYLEGVGRGLKITHDPLPFLAVPTTGGTGAEATKNAVISQLNPPFKKSLRSERMMSTCVLVDPELSVGLSALHTAHTGMDAITQLIESYISRRARPVPRALAIEGLRQALPALSVAVADGANRPAREAMAQAAFLSGVALANSGLGFAHGVAAALGALVNVPHGLACAVMLPVALRVNRETSLHDLATLERATSETHYATGEAAADAFLRRIDELADGLRIPRQLRELGVTCAQLPALAAGSRGNSMDGNPRVLDDAELLSALEAVW